MGLRRNFFERGSTASLGKFFILLLSLHYCLPLSAQPGQLDTTFTVGTGANGIKKMDVAPNGKIILAGSFTEYNGVTRKGLAQINRDGTLDTAFDSGNLASALVETWALEYTADNKIMLSELFSPLH